MKKIIVAITACLIVFSTLIATPGAQTAAPDAQDDQTLNRCLAPFKPMLPMKPFWCHGTWTQILRCDQSCNCYWDTICVE